MMIHHETIYALLACQYLGVPPGADKSLIAAALAFCDVLLAAGR